MIGELSLSRTTGFCSIVEAPYLPSYACPVTDCRREEGDMHQGHMHPADLMEPDLLCGIVLLTSGVLILLTLIFVLVLALATEAALP